MKLNIHASSSYELSADTFTLLMVEPALVGPAHRVREENLVTTPTPFSELWTDTFGNPQRRLLAPAGPFRYDFKATIETEPNREIPDDAAEHPPKDIPADAMVYTLPSRYCQSDLLSRVALDEFGGLPPGGRRVKAIAAWLYQHVEYRYGTTDSMTSAYDTVTQRAGVCRDFAHLTIAFCRALGIPARYVSGYCLGLDPPDFHGYAQAYLGGAWYNVDSTFQGVRRALVPIAVGRDAADVAMTTFFGAGTFREQTVEVREAGGGASGG